jgi:hypothetical protein
MKYLCFCLGLDHSENVIVPQNHDEVATAENCFINVTDDDSSSLLSSINEGDIDTQPPSTISKGMKV